jgi:hypothetical protein
MSIPNHIQETLKRIKADSEDFANGRSPFYLASYQEIRKRGWENAERNLFLNLHELLKIMENDCNLIDNEKRIRVLKKDILSIGSIDFTDQEFYIQHRRRYISTVNRLVKERNHINDNPNLPLYKKYARWVDPSAFIQYPIFEVFECFNGTNTKIYQNKNPQRNQIDFLNFFQTKAGKHIQMRGGSPFGYLILPESIAEEQSKFFIQSGGRAGALAGGGKTQFYIKETDKFVLGSSYVDWMS